MADAVINNERKVNLRVTDGERPNIKKVLVEFSLTSDSSGAKESDLGKTSQCCKVCGASGEFRTWKIKEMQRGTRDEYVYFECGECGTLQIEEIPVELDKYTDRNKYFVTPDMPLPNRGVPANNRAVLDINCATGHWLCSLVKFGYQSYNLFGCDPNLNFDIKYPNGVQIYKKSIHEMEGRFDLIQFNDTFQSMPEPNEVFKSVDRLLKSKKEQSGEGEPYFEIVLPVYPNITTELYGIHSQSISAPLNFFMYSEKALKLLADRYGFYIASKREQQGWQSIAASRAFQMDMPWNDYTQKFNENSFWGDAKEAKDYFTLLSQCSVLAKHSEKIFFTFKRKA